MTQKTLVRVLFIISGWTTLLAFALFALNRDIPVFWFSLLLSISFSALLVESILEGDSKLFFGSLLLLVLNALPFVPNPSNSLGFLLLVLFSLSLVLVGLSFYEKRVNFYSWIGVLFTFAGTLTLVSADLAAILFEIGLGLLAYYFFDRGVPKKIKIPIR